MDFMKEIGFEQDFLQRAATSSCRSVHDSRFQAMAWKARP
jgi:hypothetical protein